MPTLGISLGHLLEEVASAIKSLSRTLTIGLAYMAPRQKRRVYAGQECRRIDQLIDRLGERRRRADIRSTTAAGRSVDREQERAFSTGDREQFTAPAQNLKVANRELGTVASIGEDGRLSLRMDGGREVDLDPHRHPHLGHGYAATSHSSQGQTADGVLIHVDIKHGAKDLLNNRMAYVAVSRGA